MEKWQGRDGMYRWERERQKGTLLGPDVSSTFLLSLSSTLKKKHSAYCDEAGEQGRVAI